MNAIGGITHNGFALESPFNYFDTTVSIGASTTSEFVIYPFSTSHYGGLVAISVRQNGNAATQSNRLAYISKRHPYPFQYEWIGGQKNWNAGTNGAIFNITGLSANNPDTGLGIQIQNVSGSAQSIILRATPASSILLP